VDVNWLTGGSCNPTARVITTSQSNIRNIGSTAGVSDLTVSPAIGWYPNPAVGFVTVEQDASRISMTKEIRFMDSFGRLVFVVPHGTLREKIDISGWPAGAYTILLIEQSGTYQGVGKLLVR
jgi:hypothetical protein